MERRKEALPLLSIVIATRNRVPYAISSIQSILEIPDPRLELVVQDNSDMRDLEAYVNINIRDSRLRYRYTPPPFSMIDNFNAAVELATGEYLCLIGDDDGVNPEIVEAAAWAKHNYLDSLAVRLSVNYLWQDTGISSTLFRKVAGGDLSIKSFSGSIIECDLEKEMKKLFRNGGNYYLNFNLPKLYHGLVHRWCLDVIHEKIGVFFEGLSPDIFASLAIACVAKRVMVTDYPLTIPGVCPGSGATYSRTGKFSRRLKDAFLFRDRGEYHWCELVPRVFTAETIWVDSGVAALCAMGRDDIVKELNITKLAAFCIGSNRGVAKIVLRDMFKGIRHLGKKPVLGAIQFVWGFITGPGEILLKRLLNRLKIIIGKKLYSRIHGQENMVEATHALTQYLRENRYSFADCVRHLKK